MKTTLTLDLNNFDGTHKVRQLLESKFNGIDKLIISKIDDVIKFTNENKGFRGKIEINIKITGEDISKADNEIYNNDMNFIFKVTDNERILLIEKSIGYNNEHHLTPTELLYLPYFCVTNTLSKIAGLLVKDIETVRSHKKSIRKKTGCKTPEALLIYCNERFLIPQNFSPI
jgi:DNA-binding CsgD family transcriptional regulator